MALSPDGRTLVTGAAGRVIEWDAGSGRMLRVLAGHEGVVFALAFSGDGKLLASGAFDGTIRLWDPPSGRLLAILQGHTGRVWSVAWSPRGRLLASASADGTTRLWDTDVRCLRDAARERAEADILAGGGDSVGAVAFSPDGQLLAEARSGAVTFWNVATRARAGLPLAVERGPGPGGLRQRPGCAFAPGGRMLATGSPDGIVRLWDLPSRRLLGTLHGHPSVVTHLAFAAGGVLVTANGRGDSGAAASVRLWDVASRRLLALLPGEATVPHGPIALTPDGRTLATGSRDHRVTLWDIGLSGAQPRKLATLEVAAWVTSLAFSPDGRVLAAGDTEGFVYLWDRASRRQKRRLVGHVGPVDTLAFSPDGKTLATGGMDRTVRLWNPEVDQEEATLTGHRDWVWALAFSPDGNSLATGSPDGTVRLWRAASFGQTDALPDNRQPRPPGAPRADPGLLRSRIN